MFIDSQKIATLGKISANYSMAERNMIQLNKKVTYEQLMVKFRGCYEYKYGTKIKTTIMS